MPAARDGVVLRVPAHDQIDITPIITHRFPLAAYRDAFMTCHAQGEHGAVKVLFDRFENEESSR